MNNIYTSINRNMIPAAHAMVHISDLALQRGYGIFDFFKVLNGKPVFLDEHIRRFYHSAAVMRIDPGIQADELKALLQELMDKNNLAESGVRITLTGGYSDDGYSIGIPNLIITQQALNLKKSMRGDPIKLISYTHQRQLPDVKSTDYLMAVWLRELVKENGADEVLYQQQGMISECPRANVFIIRKGTLITPGKSILKGIIREKVLGLANGLLPIEERPVSLEECYTAEEVFITSTTKNILPVSHIDGNRIADGLPGELTGKLRGLLEQLIIT